MDKQNGFIVAALGSFLVAFAGGTLAGTLLWFLGGWSFLQGAFVGLLVFVILWAIVGYVVMRPLPGPGEVKLQTPAVPQAAAPTAKAPSVPAPKAEAPSAPAPAAAPAPVVAKEEAAPVAPKAAPAKKAPAKKAAAAKAPAKKDAKPAAAKDAAPALMMSAPDGTADDLKKISGVGPKLEQTLNDLGVWHYSQVAKFKKKDIAWVDERLRFKGRIERDDWVGQAKALEKAKG